MTKDSKQPETWDWATLCDTNPLVCTTVAAFSRAVGPQYGRGLSSDALTKATKRVVYEGNAARIVADEQNVGTAILWRNTGAVRDIIYRRLKSSAPETTVAVIQAIGQLAGEPIDAQNKPIDVASLEADAVAEMQVASHPDQLGSLRRLSNLAVRNLAPVDS